MTSRDSFKLFTLSLSFLPFKLFTLSFKPYPEKYYFVRLSTLVIQFTHVQVIIEAVLEGHPKYTELFSESLNEGLVRGNCPGFIVASSEEGLKKQHFSLDSPFNIHTLLIQPDEMKSVDLTENMHFSYSSARDAYTLYDHGTSPKISKTHTLQSYAAGRDIQWQKTSDYSKGTETFIDLSSEVGTCGEIDWTFKTKPGHEVEVNNLLVYVNSDDDVKWQLKIWTSENQLDPIELSPKQEKFDKLNKTVSRMKLTAEVPSTKARIFEENMLKNQVSMLVSINKATDVYLNDTGHLNDDIPAPSAQNKKKAIVLLPDENDMFFYEHLLDDEYYLNKAMIIEKVYRV